MLKANLDPQQTDIVKDICDNQIQSLIRVSMGDHPALKDIPANCIHSSISEFMQSFSKLKSNPSILFTLEQDAISLFRHQLNVNDERYNVPSHRSAKCSLWKKLFLMENVIQPIMS